MFIRALVGALVLAASSAAFAQDDVQNFNAFAAVTANGTLVRSGATQLVVAATLAGPFFIETDEGPQQAGRVNCALSSKVDQSSRKTSASGGCTVTAIDGGTAWGEFDCAGYELVGCRGAFKLTGGTGRFEGASGESTLIWRPTAHDLKPQQDGTTLDNATGIVLWRDFKLKGK